ncbi:PucR family transcriptional regulator [Nocardia carnea]|uniref:PucR family transcriptional regulator n=1 Tax=Nocardia carnea TaxID=37328 RepID=UPI0024541C82|nr:helix-turn-helix domain-containing protein [Nocardia carnea]
MVFTRGAIGLSNLTTDLAIRLARSAGVAGIVAEASTRDAALATKRLADTLSMPLIAVPPQHLDRIIARCDPFVRAPEIHALRVLGETIERFLTPPTDSGELVDKLRQLLGIPVALVDSEGHLVAGDSKCHGEANTPEGRWSMSVMRPMAGMFENGAGRMVLVQPIQTDRRAPANLWLVAVTDLLPARLYRPVLHALGVAALSYAGHLASQATRIERESRHRSMLLAELIESEEVSASTLEKMSALRWRLGGWHTAVYITARRIEAGPAGRLTVRPLENLVAVKFGTFVIEQSDGLVFWTTSEVPEAEPGDLGHIDSVRELLSTIDPRDAWGLCAGVGSSELGAAGIKRSLSGARKAALVAQGRTDSFAVEHAAAASAAALLAGWFSNNSLRDAASEILGRLVAADPNHQLLRTLRCYLDYESSATNTAEKLGVHRNTVLLRLERIRALLDVDLGNVDDRLLLQLATRAFVSEKGT